MASDTYRFKPQHVMTADQKTLMFDNGRRQYDSSSPADLLARVQKDVDFGEIVPSSKVPRMLRILSQGRDVTKLPTWTPGVGVVLQVPGWKLLPFSQLEAKLEERQRYLEQRFADTNNRMEATRAQINANLDRYMVLERQGRAADPSEQRALEDEYTRLNEELATYRAQQDKDLTEYTDRLKELSQFEDHRQEKHVATGGRRTKVRKQPRRRTNTKRGNTKRKQPSRRQTRRPKPSFAHSRRRSRSRAKQY